MPKNGGGGEGVWKGSLGFGRAGRPLGRVRYGKIKKLVELAFNFNKTILIFFISLRKENFSHATKLMLIAGFDQDHGSVFLTDP